MDLSLNKDAAAKIKFLADFAEPHQLKEGVEIWPRVPRPSPCLLNREKPERASFLISCPSWFQPASKNHKNSLSQYFSTSASRPGKEQEVRGRVKIQRKEELNPLHIKSSKTSSVACHSTWVSMCFHCKPRGAFLRQKTKTQCECWYSFIQHRCTRGQQCALQKTDVVLAQVSLQFKMV